MPRPTSSDRQKLVTRGDIGVSQSLLGPIFGIMGATVAASKIHDLFASLQTKNLAQIDTFAPHGRFVMDFHAFSGSDARDF